MFLKRVTVSGFKSFCDRVDFDFGPGVTGIVGPNGCGKSNVVDAFKWVLGEQSAKSLRGRQMIDMIFNGSSSRKASSVAQVDLIFDNSDRSLPVDMDEVTVSRKLYRSGDSEYLMNKAASRLKDIRELFMDTGVGVDAYSVIEQGRVDQLLQSSPVDRRIIFEEAAGISKYKARKIEAERKLERTQQNLLRVADLIDELERRLRSVRLAAGKARNYREYEARLNELRSSFAMAEFHRFTEQIALVTKQVDGCTDRMMALKADLDRHEKDETTLAVQLDRLAEDINRADAELSRNRSAQTALEERIAASQRRHVEQSAQLERSKERLDGDQRRFEESGRELSRLEAVADELQRESQSIHGKIDEQNTADRDLARSLTEAQATLEDEKAGIIELLRKSAQTNNEIIRLNTHRESLVGQKGRLSERGEQVRAELETTYENKARIEKRLGEVEQQIVEETARLEEKRAEAARVGGVRQRLLDELARSKENRSAMQSRRGLLEDLQRKMEGVGAGVRRVLDAVGGDEALRASSGVVGLLADLFEVDVTDASLIEAALGERDQYLVVKSAREFLDSHGVWGDLPGRLTLLGLDALPPVINDRSVEGLPGVIARAIDLVRFDEVYAQLARHVLGRTLVVEDLPAALDLLKRDVGGHRFVTRLGEVVEADGRVRVGPLKEAAGIISRKSELRELEKDLAETELLIGQLADQLNRTEAEVGHLEAVQQELRTAIYESNTAKVEATASLQAITDTIQRLGREQPLIANEVAMLEHQIREVLERSEKGGQSLEALERENKDREARVAGHQERIDGVVSRRRAVQEQLTQLRVQAGQITEKRAGALESINTLRRSIRELEGQVQLARNDIEQCEARIAEAAATSATAREELSKVTEAIREQEDRSGQLRGHREDLRLQLDGAAQASKAARQALGEVEGERHKHEMTLAEARVRRDDLVARIREEMSIDLPERYGEYRHEEQDWAGVEAEITELRQKMERLGNVNLDAITELEELEQRHQFITTQRDDLAESRRQLEQLIEKLNEESRERFRAVFEQIRDNFRGLFRKLFGGGRADIVLEDPTNPLDCGIEIVAQPPGKELRSISLMSGGEKSMTAIALLMSIFKSRPAPFAILDEVDAALDELNNDRFNRIVKEFVSESQFIIITHSKRTMSIADRLYGITMQEPGVSTRVSVELGQASAA